MNKEHQKSETTQQKEDLEEWTTQGQTRQRTDLERAYFESFYETRRRWPAKQKKATKKKQKKRKNLPDHAKKEKKKEP
jgi:hypothetical protein